MRDFIRARPRVIIQIYIFRDNNYRRQFNRVTTITAARDNRER